VVRRRGARKRISHTGRHLAALPILFTGAGNRTSGPVLRSGSPRLVISEAWAWLTATQMTRASAAAALRSEAAQARALRREDAAPVTADEESFTAVVRHMIRSMTSTQVTATSSLDAIAAAAETAARAAAHPEHPRTAAALQTRAESTPEIPARLRDQDDRHRETPGHRIRARLLLAPARTRTARKEETARARGTADRGTARHPRRDTRVPGHALTPPGNRLPCTHRTQTPQTPQEA